MPEKRHRYNVESFGGKGAGQLRDNQAWLCGGGHFAAGPYGMGRI